MAVVTKYQEKQQLPNPDIQPEQETRIRLCHV